MGRSRPASGDATPRIRVRFRDVFDEADGKLLFRLDEAGDADRLFAEFCQHIQQLEIDQPSLESVFLSLTGRDLRETMVAASGRSGLHGR